MKSFLLFVCLIGVLLAWECPRATAQDLPTGLSLPPRPAAMVQPPAAKLRLAGLPGGPAQVFVPISHLTLPEKPAPAVLGGSDATATASEPGPAEPDEAPPGEPPPVSGHPLLSPADQPLPIDLLPPTGELPSPLSDELPAPDGAMPDQPDPVAPAGSREVPDTDLSPSPQKSADSTDPKARGPIFRVKGSEAFAVARQRGYCFTPAGAIGRRDGYHSVASQVPNVLTSEVHGTRMMQMRPSPLWTTPYIENTFYMFCDASFNAVRLAPGWKIRGIQLKGSDWQWVACPRSGASTASFSLRIRAWKRPDAPPQGTVVTLHGLTLEGPPGATDWKAAFPDLKVPAASTTKR